MLYKNSSGFSLLFTLYMRFGLDAIAAYKALFTGDAGYFIAVAKAHFHFINWVLFHQNKSLFVKEKNSLLQGKFAGSILWQYYFKRKKTFLEIVGHK